jgi:hypothetical protein
MRKLVTGGGWASLRVRLSRAHDSDPVVSEGEMDAGYFGFRHVAGYAVLPAYAAYFTL